MLQELKWVSPYEVEIVGESGKTYLAVHVTQPTVSGGGSTQAWRVDRYPRYFETLPRVAEFVDFVDTVS